MTYVIIEIPDSRNLMVDGQMGRELIRCMDCKHYYNGACLYAYGLINASKPSCWCCYAERKDE